MKAVDLFAGLGGFTEGARQAGYSVIWASNHWQDAVFYHSTNHPGVTHVCQDLRQADWGQIPSGFDILLASPSCKGHTIARGKEKPHHDGERATAWAVIDCAEHHRPPFIVVENVPEFIGWILFPAWKDALQRLGYAVSINTINAADLGVPQRRIRTFIICTRSKRPFELRLPQRPHVPASAILDFNAGDWTSVRRRGRSANTLRRYRNGREKHGDRFLLPYYSSARGGRSLNSPLGTVTTVERFALVDGNRMRMLLVDEYRRAMGFPDTYALPADRKMAVHLLGNAVPPPMARDVLAAINPFGLAHS